MGFCSAALLLSCAVPSAAQGGPYEIRLDPVPERAPVGVAVTVGATVVDAAGGPVAGATVALAGSGEERVSDGAGRASFTVVKEAPGPTEVGLRLVSVAGPDGPVPVPDVAANVTVLFTGLRLSTSTAYAGAGAENRVPLRISWLHDDTPVENATLDVGDDEGAIVRTDAGGRAEVRLAGRDPGVTRLSVRVLSAPFEIRHLEGAWPVAAWLTEEDAPAERVAGRVLDAREDALSGAIVRVTVATVLNERLLNDTYETTTERNGSYRVDVQYADGDALRVDVHLGGRLVGAVEANATAPETTVDVATSAAPGSAWPGPALLAIAFLAGAAGGVVWGFSRSR
ncbi:MAG: hypothetical protein ACT4PT_03020 [Methanobacteriota archaeon]